MKRVSVTLFTCAALSLVFLPEPAAAQTPTSVTLSASASSVAYGDPVTLSGATDPATVGASVEIRDEAGGALTTASTGAAGAFSVELVLERTTELRAVWETATSEPVLVGVGVVVSVRLSGVRLFGTASAGGTVAPALSGMRVAISLIHGGRVVATRHPEITSGGRFRAGFPIEDVGGYRVRASYADAEHLRGTASDGPLAPPLPSLGEGSRTPFVRLLERRLVDLHYRLVGVDVRYDFRTADAVLAFRKVQGLRRVFTVDATVWRAMADPLVLRPRSDSGGFHIEVDLTRQVLSTVDDGEVTNIIHVSTGKPSTPTRDGTFRVSRKIAGFSPNHLYYPSYFDGSRAIHGWPDVPTYAASHGCVRVPYWDARWIYGLARIGTRVFVHR